MISDEQETPQELFDKLNEEFGPFDLDACATSLNAKTRRFLTSDTNAMLLEEWQGSRIWINPPYSKRSAKTNSYGIQAWVAKAMQQAYTYNKLVVMLLPADTSTKWFHDLVVPHATEYRFLRGRAKFNGVKNGAKFGSLVAVFDGLRTVRTALLTEALSEISKIEKDIRSKSLNTCYTKENKNGTV